MSNNQLAGLHTYIKESFRDRHTRSNIPSRRKDQEIGKRTCDVTGLGSQDTENGGINVINGDGADIDEFGHVILVGNL